MSSDLALRNTIGTSEPSTPTAQPLALASNMLMVVAKSSQPLQQEIIKTAQAMESFMEKMQQNFEALSLENKLLKEELLREKTRNQESQTAHLAQTKAFNEALKIQDNKIKNQDNKINTLQNDLAALQKSHNSLNHRHGVHQHVYMDSFGGGDFSSINRVTNTPTV